MGSDLRLGDLGERRIVRDVLRLRYGGVENFGDDAATLATMPSASGALVATTDPCPPPMAEILGATDQFYAGWLLATLNLSDLAAAGAQPLGLVTSLILSNEMTLGEFGRLLDGIDGCCAAADTRVVGGNLKEGTTRDLTATAVGLCENREPLRRTGARVGDRVVVIGDIGSFWSGVLSVRRGVIRIDDDDDLLRNVLTPAPKSAAMVALAARGLVTAAIDNSDGLYPSLEQLAMASQCSIRVDRDAFVFTSRVVTAANGLHVDPLRLALGWGDWQVIVCCASKDVDEVRSIAAAVDIASCAIGEITEGEGVFLQDGSDYGPLMPLDSERFTRTSWFTAGLDGYIETLLNAPLIQPERGTGGEDTVRSPR